jgi:hypothetical protein
MIGRGYGHTEADTLDKVFLRGMQMSAALVARLVASIANADYWPAVERRTDAQVREMLEKNKFLAAAIKTGYLQG